MERALLLAARALGTSSPNPAVGAVLVRGGEIVGEGTTRPPGQGHAEVVAIEAAGEAARGAALYVTLEPCAHFGRTPPCVDAIIAAGIREVHAAMIDPSPWVNGKGVAALEQAGIPVTVGERADEARRLNAAYLTWVLQGRPLVTATYAVDLTGCIMKPADAPLGERGKTEVARLRAHADRTCADVGALFDGDPTLAGLAGQGITSLLVECGPADLERLQRAGMVDRLAVFLTLSVDGEQIDDADVQRVGASLLVTAHLDERATRSDEPGVRPSGSGAA
ncbi:MAG: bifunctional diaminohydroxyphosphoribosylaminopyrimidine deaminase/5-amino-6-(5-phosphoribosylamino)uracil reductase RibD [Chloroflexi bacterium]|nr:bifunctional diaminohydroxyphosphoribosylaminopyrimidine deaminase/5-amino-6-(5-phosphoribosylamino)uracil reductase RibD [Chloroflexota bacterium]